MTRLLGISRWGNSWCHNQHDCTIPIKTTTMSWFFLVKFTSFRKCIAWFTGMLHRRMIFTEHASMLRRRAIKQDAFQFHGTSLRKTRPSKPARIARGAKIYRVRSCTARGGTVAQHHSSYCRATIMLMGAGSHLQPLVTKIKAPWKHGDRLCLLWAGHHKSSSSNTWPNIAHRKKQGTGILALWSVSSSPLIPLCKNHVVCVGRDTVSRLPPE